LDRAYKVDQCIENVDDHEALAEVAASHDGPRRLVQGNLLQLGW
jgi:hypothetical protein